MQFILVLFSLAKKNLNKIPPIPGNSVKSIKIKLSHIQIQHHTQYSTREPNKYVKKV